MDGLSRNPSASDLDTTKAHWHEETNLEIMSSWHVVSFICTLANGCHKVSCQVQVDPLCISRSLKMELDEIGFMDIIRDAQVLTYL